MKKLINVFFLFILLSNISYASMAVAVIQNAIGNVDHNIKIFSQFTYEINNTSDSYQNYIGEEMIELDGQSFKNPISFRLPPHKETRKSDPAILNYNAKKAGIYKAKASIKIIGYNGAENSNIAIVTVKP